MHIALVSAQNIAAIAKANARDNGQAIKAIAAMTHLPKSMRAAAINLL